MLNTIIFKIEIGKVLDPDSKTTSYFSISILDPAMNTESGSVQDLAEELNQIYAGRKIQNRGSELLFWFSFDGGLLFGGGEKKFLRKLTEEEQCKFSQKLKVN